MRKTTIKSRKVSINSRKIGIGEPTFIIAEAGVAHFGSIARAFKLIDMAVDAGADAVKFQVFKTENLVSRIAPDWIERLKPKELPYDAFKRIKDHCVKKRILFLATAHEEESADFLESIKVPAFKIGSGEVKNIPFIRHIAKKNVPLIISTGLHTLSDIHAIIEACKKEHNNNIVLLHCVTAYPSPAAEVNLRAIATIQNKFKVPVGYSDHTVGFAIPLAAVVAGACVIEKHICLDKNTLGSQDCRVACDRKDLTAFVKAVREIEAAMGDGEKVVSETAKKSMLWARKSVVASRDLPPHHILSRQDIAFKRPGTGISPVEINNVLGRVLKKSIKQDELILWRLLA
jgi:N,N'-diacetyllegionaminate synthase